MEKVIHHTHTKDHSPCEDPGGQSQVYVTVQCKVHREDKTWTAEKYFLSSKLHLFSHPNHCILQLHSSRTDSNEEEISDNNSAFSIVHLC